MGQFGGHYLYGTICCELCYIICMTQLKGQPDVFKEGNSRIALLKGVAGQEVCEEGGDVLGNYVVTGCNCSFCF